MQKTLLFKLFAIFGLMLLLSIPLLMIESTIKERLYYREEAVRSIAQDSVSEQTLLGPIIVIPYTEYYTVEELENADSKTKVKRQRSETRHHYIYPSELNVRSVVDTDQRYRGIHKVLVYNGTHALTGKFDLPDESVFIAKHTESQIKLWPAYVSVGLSDTRGLRNTPKIMLGGKVYEFMQESKLASFKNGIHAPISIDNYTKPTSLAFSLDFSIDGIEQLSFTPIAKNTHVTLQSQWPHPHFFGRFLPSPKELSVTQNGFSATWNISSLASNAQQQFYTAEVNAKENNVSPQSSTSGAGPRPVIDTFGVALIEPINIYSQADRAIKYGLLFIALTFSAFFLFEILKQLPIHPIQYGLVGIALAIFFLLLVSLSEHIAFHVAYLIASFACLVLIGFYLKHALKNWKTSMGFTLALATLYAVLFGLLQSENNALIMGSTLLFAVLSAMMIVTRKVDWYQIGKPNTSASLDNVDNLNNLEK